MSRFHKVLAADHLGGGQQTLPAQNMLDGLNKTKLELIVVQTPVNVPENDKSAVPNVVKSVRTGSEKALRKIIRARADRLKYLPVDLFADPAWDMLLDLYLGDILSKRISISSLCTASNVPATTALRWIGALGNEGLIDRGGDPCDARRSFISLSKSGLERMDAYFSSLALYATRRAH